MKMFCISESLDISLGLRLSGIEYDVLKDKNKILEKINELLENKDYGIIILTEKIYEMISDEVKKLEKERNIPLFIKIPEIGDEVNERYKK